MGVVIALTLGYVPAGVSLEAIGGFVAVGLVVAVFFTGLALLFSSLTTRALYAGVAIFGLVLSLLIGTGVVAGATANPYVPYASPLGDVSAVAQAAFGAGSPSIDPYVAAAILLAGGLLFLALAGWRLSRVEVVGES